jgi:hypothetical protein
MPGKIRNALTLYRRFARWRTSRSGSTRRCCTTRSGLSPRSVSDLERGINRTARKDTAELLAGALRLDGPARESFVAAARGRISAEDVLAARDGGTPSLGHRGTRGCPYRGLLPFGESDAEVFYGRERLAAELAAKLAARAAGGGLVVVTGASGSGKSSLLRAGCCRSWPGASRSRDRTGGPALS